MFKARHWVLAVLVTGIGLMGFGQQEIAAQDLVEFIPEYQMARAVEVAFNPLSEIEELIEICPQDLEPSDVPSSYFVDADGQLRSDDALRAITFSAMCLMTHLERYEPGVDPTPWDQYDLARYRVIEGDTVTFPNGHVIDGANQTFRVAAILATKQDLVGEAQYADVVSAGALEQYSLGADPCGALFENATNGSTLELRWLSFSVLTELVELSKLQHEPNACSALRFPDSGNFMERALNGDPVAAVHLSYNWIDPVLQQVRGPASSADVVAMANDQIAMLEGVILQHTESDPLVALAASTALGRVLALQQEAVRN